MYIEKIILNGFGGVGEKEIYLDSPFTILCSQDPKELKTIEDAISMVLFGNSPDKRGEFQKYILDRKFCSVSLILNSETGKRYIMGRDFIEERLEIFAEEGMRMIPQPSTVLMDLLRAELGTLNPLDFEAIFLLKRNDLDLNQNSLGIRDEMQKILKAYQEGITELIFNKRTACTIESSEENKKKIQEEISRVLNHLEKLEGKMKEYGELKDVLSGYKEYEVFLSDDNKNQIEVLSQQLTASALERKYLEEKVKEYKKIHTTLEQEKKSLQNKIGVFEELFSPERQKIINSLINLKEEKNNILKKLELEYSYGNEKKGLLSRRGKERGVAEEKMNNLLKELSDLRTEIEGYLHNRTVDKYLKDCVEYKENKENLIRLQQSPTNVETLQNEEELSKMVEQEKETGKKLEKLLLMAGSNDLKDLKMKVNELITLKERRRKIEKEINLLSGDYEPLEAIKIMKEKIAHFKEELEIKEEVTTDIKHEEDIDPEEDPLFKFYVKGYEYLNKVFKGTIKGFVPEFTEGKYKFKILYEGAWHSEEKLSPQERNLFFLVLRLSLARLHAPARRFPYIVNNLMSGFRPEYILEIKEEIISILQELSSNIQVIYLADSNEKSFFGACSGDNYLPFRAVKQL